MQKNTEKRAVCNVLDRLEARLQGGTPRPWRTDINLNIYDAAGYLFGRLDDGQNMTLTLAAVNALLALVAAVRAAGALLDSLRPVMDPDGTYPVHEPLRAALARVAALEVGE